MDSRHGALTATLGAIVVLVLVAIPVVPWMFSSPSSPEAPAQVEVVRGGPPVVYAKDRVGDDDTQDGTQVDPSTEYVAYVVEVMIEAVDELRPGATAMTDSRPVDSIGLTVDGGVEVAADVVRALRKGSEMESVVVLDEVSVLDDVSAIVFEHVSYRGRGRAGDRHRVVLSGSTSIPALHEAPSATMVDAEESLLDIVPWPAGTWVVTENGLELWTELGPVHVAPGEVVTHGPFAAAVTLRSQQGGVEVVRGRVAFSTTATVRFRGLQPVRVREE